MDPVTQTIKRLDAYLAKKGERATNFGVRVFNNSALVFRLRSGNVTAKTLKKVAEFLDKEERLEKRRRV
jgi:hypothetical protein